MQILKFSHHSNRVGNTPLIAPLGALDETWLSACFKRSKTALNAFKVSLALDDRLSVNAKHDSQRWQVVRLTTSTGRKGFFAVPKHRGDRFTIVPPTLKYLTVDPFVYGALSTALVLKDLSYSLYVVGTGTGAEKAQQLLDVLCEFIFGDDVKDTLCAEIGELGYQQLMALFKDFGFEKPT